MEQDDQSIFDDKPHQPEGCAGCGSPIIEPGHPTPLCKECRSKFIKFPIPVGIKLFAGLIGVALLFSMFQVKKSFSAGIYYERGKKAVTSAHYFTAERELKKVIEKIPNYQDAQEYLAVAAFHNQDFETFSKTLDKLQGKEVKQEKLFAEINEITKKFAFYIPGDSMINNLDHYHSFDSIPDQVYKDYLPTHPDDLATYNRYVSLLMDRKQFQLCDSLLDHVLAIDPTQFDGLGIKTALKRELKQFDSSHYYCDRLFALNRESTYAMSTKARTYLKQGKDAQGLEWAQKSIDLDKNDSYSIATLALAYHFNNKTADRDKLIEASKKDSAKAIPMQYIIDIVQGKEKFRE